MSTENDVSLERAVSVIKEFPALNIDSVLFSGGEPLLRKDFPSLLKEIDTSFTRVYIASNGMPITPQLARTLKESGVFSIDISLDGHNAELHNAVRLHPLAFQKAIDGVRNCVREDIPLRVSGMITPANIDFIVDFVGLLVSLGVKKTVMSTIVESAGRAKENPHLSLSAELIPKALESVHRARELYGDAIVIDHRLSEETQDTPGCAAGLKFLFISPEGDVAGCSWLFKTDPKRFSLGNIKHESLSACLERNELLMSPLIKLTPWCPIPYVRA
jgi:MoaA/NifB/PqqE/SkfB family radical SAM enzyme